MIAIAEETYTTKLIEPAPLAFELPHDLEAGGPPPTFQLVNHGGHWSPQPVAVTNPYAKSRCPDKRSS